ncbi:MAG TPA: hypothetical protein VK369_11320, partial [Segetibacter sp.]|nr:hypothetical protein [Segetibacter sp.]
KLPDVFAGIGLYKRFERAGCKIVAQASKNRAMVRYYIQYDSWFALRKKFNAQFKMLNVQSSNFQCSFLNLKFIRD